MLKDLKTKQRRVLIYTLLGGIIYTGLHITNMVIVHQDIIKYDLCDGNEFLESKIYNDFLRLYFGERITASLLIDFWLIWQTRKVMLLLKAESENGNKRNFNQEKRRINFIYWTFVLTYISWTIADMIQVIYGMISDESIQAHTDQEMDLLFFLTFDYVPIFTVFFTHFMNYSSVRAILKMAWEKERDADHTEDSSSAPRLINAHQEQLPQIMLKNLELLSMDSNELAPTTTNRDDFSNSAVSTLIKHSSQKIIEDHMRKYIKFEVPQDIENCEDLIRGLREKRLSLDKGVLEEFLRSPLLKQYSDQAKRESYDFVKRQNELR